MASVFAEAMSGQPTRRLENVATLEPVTPGGLAPSNNVPTLGKMQAGSLTAKLVVAIEGCKYLLSDAPSASVLTAWAGTDWTEVLGGLFVELQNTQSITPDDPLPNAGRCIVRVLDVDGTDAFGIYVNKRASGDKTTLTQTHDRNDATLTVAAAADFASSGEVYVGTECVGYTGKGATTLTGATRGKYSPFGCDSTGTGGARFARHHRVSTDVNTTLSNPVVSEVPRNWVGKFCGVWLHTWDEATEQLNVKSSAQLLYAGRVVGISDSAQDMCTSLEIEHISAEFKNGVIGRDMLAAEITSGLYLVEGRFFSFRDIIMSGPAAAPANATDLAVVVGAPANAYEVQAGYYNGDEIAAILSRWLAQALTDGDINGNYVWNYAVSSSVGPRSKCYWRIENANSYNVSWGLKMPGEVAAFLGFGTTDDVLSGQQVAVIDAGKTSNESAIRQGEHAPYSTLIFKPFGPGSLGQEFASYTLKYELENERGGFIDQTALLPASIKESSQGDTGIGLFLLDEKVLMIASYDETAATLTNCRLAPFQLTADKEADAVVYIGRRMDEPPAPVTVRQVLALEGSFKDIFGKLVYSTGVSGYNGTNDTLAHGFGLAVPGSLLGPEWDRSLANLPGAESPLAIVIDEPTKFSDLFRDDLRLRRAFIRWHDQGFEFGTWRTPMVALADHTLTEANKAAPAGVTDSHRIASEETDQWHYSVVKIDYCRDFGTGRNAQYLKSIQLEDQSGTDGSGAMGRTLTLKMRNTFPQFANTGAGIEDLVKEYLVGLPMFSRPSRTIVRSIDLRNFETIAVGDICLLTDSFARDPLTGQRGIESRAGIVTRINYNLGGPMPDGSVRGMVGEVELFFLDTHRGGIYNPAADVDHEKNYAGFSAGYNATTKQLWLAPSKYSWTLVVQTIRGPITHTLGRDVNHWNVGDNVTVCEIDPSNTAAPATWNDTIVAINGDMATLTTGLAGWNSAKRHRIFARTYTACTATQQDFVFQADATDEMIENEEIADQFASTNEQVTFTRTSATDKAEFVADLTWGDGKPLDPGTDAALAKTINAYHDYKSAHQQPMLWQDAIATGTVGDFSTSAAPGQAALIHLGTDILSGTITRSLTCALWLRSSSGVAAYARVTLSRAMPIGTPGVEDAALIAAPFYDPQYPVESSRSATVTTTSTTWATTEDLTVSIGVKDLQWGCAWLVVELAGPAECRGFAKLIEGPRTTT